MGQIIGIGRHARDVYPVARWPIPAIPGVVKSLQNGVPLPLLQIDITQTLDNTFAARLQFAAECTDGTDSQIRQGDCNSAAAYKVSTATFTTSQAQSATNAFTAGALTTTFSWTISGTIATLNVTVTTTLAVPTDFKFHYYVPFATHSFTLL